MGVLNVYHPDIEIFLEAKAKDANALKHFNISVMVDDDFIEAAKRDKTVFLHWPVYDDQGHIIKDPSQWKISREVSAKELWDKIIRKAYDNGEPGIFFYDNMNADNNTWYDETIVCSNPCAEYLAGTVFDGELPSSQYGGACNLGSLVLPSFVINPFINPQFDKKKLQRTICWAVRMLDNIIDVNTFPDEIYSNYQKRYRTIGLGYTGLADMLVMMNYKYDTEEARNFVFELTEFIALNAYKASIDLAKEKGSFPGCKKDLFANSGFITKHVYNSDLSIRSKEWEKVREDIATYGIRNARLISVAPTGTISMVYGNNCSSGIEPIFSLKYKRKIKMGGQSDENTKEYEIMDYAYLLYQNMQEQGIVGHEHDDKFVTALEMDVDAHIYMLADVAFNVDMSVSKTINVPSDYSFEKCKDIYMKCWESGIKGCTIFRPNEIRQGILISEENKKEQEETTKHESIENSVSSRVGNLRRGDIICCDDTLVGIKKKLTTGCGTMHLMAWYDPVSGDIMETFVGRGSSGGCEKNLTAMARLISAGLRGGIPINFLIDQLGSCGGCSAYQARRATKHDTSPGSSCATAIGIALKEMQDYIYADLGIDIDQQLCQKQEEKENNDPYIHLEQARCPECGEPIIFEGGCNICKACGWSKCG